MRTGSVSQKAWRPRREADRLPPTSVEVMKTWIYLSTTTYVFIALFLITWAQGQLYVLPYRTSEPAVDQISIL
jgi:hypothetical protein